MTEATDNSAGRSGLEGAILGSRNLVRPTFVSSRRTHEGWLRVRQDTLTLPNGQTQKYDVVEAVDSVMVVPITNTGNVVLTREYRHPVNDEILNLPSGRINENETPEKAAYRELAEETGYSAGYLEILSRTCPWPGISGMLTYTILAADLKKGRPHPDDDESIQIVEMPYHQFLGRLLKPWFEKETANMQLQYGLMMLELKRQKGELDEKWGHLHLKL